MNNRDQRNWIISLLFVLGFVFRLVPELPVPYQVGYDSVYYAWRIEGNVVRQHWANVFQLLVRPFFGVWMLQIYAVTRSITTNVALASIAFTLIGLFAVSTSITLYAISRLVSRTNNHHR